MNIFKLFIVWRKFIGWWGSLFISIGLKKPINWTQKVSDLTKITNDALDASGKCPPIINANLTASTEDSVEPEVNPQRKRRIGKLIDRIRNKLKPPAENKSGDYKLW